FNALARSRTLVARPNRTKGGVQKRFSEDRALASGFSRARKVTRSGSVVFTGSSADFALRDHDRHALPMRSTLAERARNLLPERLEQVLQRGALVGLGEDLGWHARNKVNIRQARQQIVCRSCRQTRLQGPCQDRWRLEDRSTKKLSDYG